jgi:chromosome segregation ATPase
MAERAHVSSLDALDTFRAALVMYISKARPTLEEVSAEVLRTRVWLEDEQRPFWQNQLRRRSRELEQANQALFSAKLSLLSDPTASEVNAVHRARKAVEEAEQKLRKIKVWIRDFDGRLQPLVKQLERLHSVLCTDLPKGVNQLTELAKLIENYAEVAPPGGGAASPVDKGSE